MMFVYLKVVRAVLFSMVLLSCSLCTGVEFTDAAFLGQERPGLTPVVFAPGVVSIPGRYEGGISFTPDGLECCFGVTNAGYTNTRIEYMQYEDGQWSTPRRAYFTPGAGEYICNFSPDGLRVFFMSFSRNNQDIWMSQRTSIQERWSVPSLIPDPVSPLGSREFSPSVTWDGTLYFTSSHRSGGNGVNDIWRAPYVNGRYSTVENLGPPVNTSAQQEGSFIAPDESYLIFNTGGRSPNYGGGDLYISFRNEDDTWTLPKNLGSRINTEHSESDPYVSIDGKTLFFTRRTSSNSDADIYWVDTASFLPDPNGPVENLSTGIRYGSIQYAIDSAESGDTLVLQPNIYHESIVMDDDITIQSVEPNHPLDMGATIIQGDPERPVITLTDNTDHAEIAGLTIRTGLVGLQGTKTDATIRNCRIMDNVTYGVELFEESNPVLTHCLITANGQSGMMMHTLEGRFPLHCKPTIEDCVIVQNGQDSLVGGEPVLINSIIE